MKNFTDSDVVNGRIYCDSSDLVDAPLDWQKRGLQQTASGYGKKLTMRQKISFNGKLYRLYSTCFSNAASVWFTVGKRTIYVA